MPKVLVTVTTRASPDGTAVHRYVAGENYGPDSDPPMPAGLAAVFLREGWGVPDDRDQAAPPRVHEEPADPAVACLWCVTPYTARKGGGGPVRRFCSDACRAAFHRGARRWAARELEAGRLDIADLREL